VTTVSSFTTLRDFIRTTMRMSHVYQPVMIRELLTRGGKASIRDIAAAFLARDASQLEYYEQVTKDMPGKVLGKHGIVERDGEGYRLAIDPSSLSSTERDELVRLCDEKVDAYLQKRGAAAYDHRRAALGYLSGSLRYEVLKRAGFRCELCGVSADDKAIEVDHIYPRKHGGKDDLSNLQALCFRCNANKGARDNTDFRVIREALNARQSGCIFCEVSADRVIASNTLAFAIRDAYPVTQLHTLVISKRHATTFFDLFEPERRAINQLLSGLRVEIMNKDAAVSGFNIGMNNGDAAGQTIGHAHVHLIPRRQGDVEDPSGGVRGVVPGKAVY
jgi:diadenosine tetraphosphate (Ap4A) HIT family hydrolase/5-methylcytosine-specific restriction endonuclease McrA